MKVVFLGTPDFAVSALQKLYESRRHQLLATVCQPDRPASRNKISVGAVKRFSTERGIPCYQFEKISRDGAETLKNLAPDIMVTAAYGQILSEEIIGIAPHGIVNIHGSLLPELRGAAPIQYAVMTGKKRTGVTIVNTVREVDAGEILLQQSVDIGENETSGQLFARLAEAGGELLMTALDLIEEGRAVYTPQDEAKATFSRKITPEQEKIVWSQSARQVHDTVRALNPSPVAWTTLGGKRLKIYETRLSACQAQGAPGEVVFVGKKYFSVTCDEGAVDVLRLQTENGKCMDTASFLNGRKIAVGEMLGI